uniref:Putative E3 ubiquitin-protein ligase UBR7 isoform X1 n=1 Tax=Rhizophora mucronata TaxID=61149 RepID=A0A2P2JA67_RHIMU
MQKIVELWTKRNFRCDCGNSKFGESFCKLFPKKDVENIENLYNHNFKGLYCTCDRLYPDPNVEEQEEMIQCVVCEDWFHEEHLGLASSNEIPRDEEGEPSYEDFICKTCSAICSFLSLYPQRIWAGQSEDAVLSAGKDKNVLEDLPSACDGAKLETNISSHGSSGKEKSSGNATCEPIFVGEASVMAESSQKNMNSTCVLGADVVVTSAVLESKPLFLSKGWRDILCRCEKCSDVYNQKKIHYLLDKYDSIAEYEKIAKQKREEKLQQQEGDELNFLNKLGHVEKIELLSGLADFKDEFRSFLESFDASKTVTSSDVQQIFENLAKKRRRVQ